MDDKKANVKSVLGDTSGRSGTKVMKTKTESPGGPALKRDSCAYSPDAVALSASPKSGKATEVDNSLAVHGTSVEQSTVNITVPSEPENLVQHSGEIADGGCCPEVRGFWEYFRNSVMYLRKSKFLLPFLFLLLSLSVSSIIMGAKDMRECPGIPAFPKLLITIGFIGTLVVCSRIFSIFIKTFFPYSDCSLPYHRSRFNSPVVLLLLAVLYIAELVCFFVAVPNFKKGSSNYCDETFYSFVFYINYISIALVIPLLLLYCPGSWNFICRNRETRIFSRVMKQNFF